MSPKKLKKALELTGANKVLNGRISELNSLAPSQGLGKWVLINSRYIAEEGAPEYYIRLDAEEFTFVRECLVDRWRKQIAGNNMRLEKL